MTSMAEVQERSRLRLWAPVASMTLLGLLSYVDRSVLAILSPTILADLHMSATQYGYAILVFSLCYMVANPVWGFWMDRVGLWVTTLIAVLVWSLASGSHGLMVGFVGMCVARGVLGFGEGATFPAGLKTVSETLPQERRSFGLGIAYSGSSLGAAITPLIITPIAVRWGWRAAFAVTAVFGIAWIALWLMLKVSGLYGTSHNVYEPRAALKNVRGDRWNRDLFAAAMAYGLGAAPLAFGLYAAPLYFTRVLHLGQVSLGHLLWLPPAGWEAGYLVFGRLADWSRRRNAAHPEAVDTRPGRIFLMLALASIPIVLTQSLGRSMFPVALTVGLFVFEMFIAGGFVVFALSDGMAVLPKQQSAFLAGICISAWALVTGMLMPIIGHLFDHAQYQFAFWMIACMPTLGVLFWQVLRTPDRVRHPVGAQ